MMLFTKHIFEWSIPDALYPEVHRPIQELLFAMNLQIFDKGASINSAILIACRNIRVGTMICLLITALGRGIDLDNNLSGTGK